MISVTTHSPEETQQFAQRLALTLKAGDIICFKGSMGAGKTTFTRGLAKGLGITDDVSSPTFALVHEYSGGRLPLAHFDMYRVNSEQALESTGFYDYIDAGGVLVVEWSENVERFLPRKHIAVTITMPDEHSRAITVERSAEA